MQSWHSYIHHNFKQIATKTQLARIENALVDFREAFQVEQRTDFLYSDRFQYLSEHFYQTLYAIEELWMTLRYLIT